MHHSQPRALSPCPEELPARRLGAGLAVLVARPAVSLPATPTPRHLPSQKSRVPHLARFLPAPGILRGGWVRWRVRWAKQYNVLLNGLSGGPLSTQGCGGSGG
eukprot:1159613-Pelagomonas_calceolata.AAC.4